MRYRKAEKKKILLVVQNCWGNIHHKHYEHYDYLRHHHHHNHHHHHHHHHHNHHHHHHHHIHHHNHHHNHHRHHHHHNLFQSLSKTICRERIQLRFKQRRINSMQRTANIPNFKNSKTTTPKTTKKTRMSHHLLVWPPHRSNALLLVFQQ